MMETDLSLPHPSLLPQRQLDLPNEHDLPPPSHHSPIDPHHLWKDLTSTDQKHFRQILIRIMQEVVHDAHDR